MSVHLVHGMGREEVPATWAPLTDAEVRRVLGRYRAALAPADPARATVVWRSPRPMSAAGVVAAGSDGGVRCFVKRHARSVRTPDDLVVEHELAAVVRAGGVAVPEVLRTDDGVTTVADATAVYEVHAVAPGLDLYRDVPSWSPYADPSHAEAAGRALARFHRAAAAFPAAPRPPGPLVVSTAVVAAPDPRAALDRLLAARPALAAAVEPARVRRDFGRWFLPVVDRVGPLLAACGGQWAHGDWHPSNVTWTAPGPGAGVVAVLDLGLANRTAAVHDLATAVERAGVDWLATGPDGVRADRRGVAALLRGYLEERPLSGAERAALPDAVRIAHLEYALSEVEYFAAGAGSPAEAAAAYADYFVGHAEWFASPAGAELLDVVRRSVTD